MAALPRVLVYLTTYNGHAFLAEQLDSLFAQEDVELTVLAGDDGSTDDTLEILESYRKKHPNLHFYQNKENLGYRLNFMTLIHHELPGEFDYYALADQDDVWAPKKLAHACRIAEEYSDVPFLYSSDLTLVDKDLNPLGGVMFGKKWAKVKNTTRFITSSVTGCTALFNNALRDLALRYPLDQLVTPHDVVLLRIALATGVYYFDTDASLVKYRQHGANQIGQAKGNVVTRFWPILTGKKKVYHSLSAEIIYKTYEAEFRDPKFKKFVWRFGHYRKRFGTYLCVLFSPKYKTVGFSGFFISKIAILFRRY